MEIKLPIYDWVVKFLNGVLAVVLWALLDGDSFLEMMKSALIIELFSKPELIVLSVSFAVAYEVGSLIDRFGSFLESIFKKISIIPFNDDYVLYNKAKAKYSVMPVLQKGYAVSRTQFTLFVIFAIWALWVTNWRLGAAFAMIAAIQYFSWRKFAGKIVKLMNAEK